MTAAGLGPAATRFLEAVNAGNLQGVLDAFAPGAVLIDQSHEMRDPGAIRRWAEAEVIGGRYEVVEVRDYATGDQMIVRFTPPGSGSGFEACYTFDTDGAHITRANLQYECP